jgi:protein-S-isoprenylcysteine O-methyltransferase Ste14
MSGRTLGSFWFLMLGTAIAVALFKAVRSGLGTGLGAAAWANIPAQVCIGGFYLILAVLILIRPNPISSTRGFAASAIAFAGTYMPWLVPFLGSSVTPTWLSFVSDGLLFCGGALIILSVVFLGRSFSIAPQARSLVRTGPYAIIRHPLYLAEEIAIFGSALHFLSLVGVVVVLMHFCIQVWRMTLEEDLLVASFPEYRAYAAKTARLVPGLW